MIQHWYVKLFVEYIVVNCTSEDKFVLMQKILKDLGNITVLFTDNMNDVE